MMLVVETIQRCSHPQAENGYQVTEGCLQRKCKSGVWRSSLVSNKCCYEGKAYSINTTISSTMSEDGCAKAAINCLEETPGNAKTIVSVENYCEEYATKDQLEEIKEMLVKQMEAGSECQGENVEVENEKDEPKVLLFGPGGNSGGKSEVLSLPDLTPLDCDIPVFPGEDGEYYSYMGRSTSDGVLMCGGETKRNRDVTSSCYLLTSSGYKTMPGLIYRRSNAASVVTPLGLWVTGGEGDWYGRDTTEIWSNNQSLPSVRLPEGMWGHCLTNINNTHALLTGGVTSSGSAPASSSAFLYSEKDGFTRIQDMKTARYYHGCSLINDSTVMVAAGDYKSSTEYLDLTSLTWTLGPDLPERVFRAQILGPEVLGPGIGHLLIGEDKIFKMEEEGPAQTRQWAKVKQMKDVRFYAQAFVVNQNVFC